MKIFKLFFFIQLQLVSVVVFSQQRSLSGKIVNAKDGSPIQSATIHSKVANSFSTSQLNGSFLVNVNNNKDTLSISITGYTEKIFFVDSNSDVIVIGMDLSIKELDQVIVTSLGIRRQTKSLTYSVQSVKPKELLEIRDADIINTFQGKIAGAFIGQGSGGLGSATTINLRGKRSFSGSSSALIVVDGVPLDNFNFNAVSSDFGNGYTGASGTSTINPDDIESMTVLRGASASALYGSAAADGVIVITTKKGKEGKISLDVNSGVTLQQVWQLPSFQNSYGQGVGGVINVDAGSSWGGAMNGQPYNDHFGETYLYSPKPNNVKDFFQDGLSFNNSFGITSGTPKTQTYLSYSNNLSKGMIPLNKLDKHIVNLRILNQVTDKLSIDAKINYVNQKIDHSPVAGENNSPIFDAYQIPRSMSIDVVNNYQFLNSANGIEAPAKWPSTLNSIYQNPYWALNGMQISQNFDKITGFLLAKYQIFPWLSLQGRANYEKVYNKDETRVKDGVLLYSDPGGTFSISQNENTNQWYDFILSGSNKLNSNFRLDYQGGAIYTDYVGKGIFGSAEGLLIPNRFSLGLGTSKITSNRFVHTRTTSVFSQANLSFKDRLFLDLSFRNDWSSTLPSENWSYPYGSVGISSIISDIIDLPKSISFLKVNLSAARVGKGAGAYQLNTSYFATTLPSLGVGYLQRATVLAPTNLKPEQTTSYEGSIDLRFLENRIGMEFTIYRSNSINQILQIPVPVASGFEYRLINAGNIQNDGIELLINANPILTKSFKWDFSLNFSMNKNKVIELYESVKRTDGFIRMSSISLIEGRPTGEIYGYGWEKNAKGSYVVDAKGLPVSTKESVYFGNLNPKALIGFTNNFTYKNISLRVLISGRIGGVAVSGNEGNLAYSGISKVTENYREGGWKLQGEDNNGQLNTKEVNAESFWKTVSGQRYGTGEFFSYDATNFRIRELALAYNFNIKNSKIKSIRASLFANNLLWIYRGKSILDIPGIAKRKLPYDPDMTLGGSSNGSDYGVFPSSRSYGFNLQLSF